MIGAMPPDNQPTSSAELRDIEAQARAWARRFAAERPTTVDAQAFHEWRQRSAAHAQAWAVASREWRDIGAVAVAFRARHPGLDRPAWGAGAASDARSGIEMGSGARAVSAVGFGSRVKALLTAGLRPASAADIAGAQGQGRRLPRRAFLGAAVSAAGALGVLAAVRPPLGLWPSWSELNADIRTATGEQRTVDVNEHIHLVLNTQTSVSIQASGAVPCVQLIAGEAAVRARGQLPLDVMAGAARIRIADAAIEVRSMERGARVICSDGRAELQMAGRTVALQAGQEIFYDDRRFEPAQARRAQDDSSWREGVVVFDAMPLSDAITEINRYRPGRVVLLNSALAAQRISGRFRIAALEQAIHQIETLYGARARRVGDVTLLT